MHSDPWENRLHAIAQLIQALPIPAQLWAPDGTVICTNHYFNKLLSLPPEFDWRLAQISLLNSPQIDGAGLRPIFERALHGVAAEIHSFSFDASQLLQSSAKSGERIKLFFSLQPLIEDDGELTSVVCVVTDYSSSELRYEHELMRSQKMENIETLASGVAHEFNNIFTGIKGMTELIKDEVDPQSEIYEFADAIHSNIKRGAELIQQLSSFAREVPYTLRLRSLGEYVQAALPLLQIQVQKRVRITVDLPVDGLVLLDASRMDQALTNILSNARDAMGGQGDILVSTRSEAPHSALPHNNGDAVGWIALEVSDSGPGIPEELQQRVVEPFFTTKERGKATGLGLSVTSRIVASHGGAIEIGRSEELGGASIKIFLPLYEDADSSR